jgi:hypothetical protein
MAERCAIAALATFWLNVQMSDLAILIGFEFVIFSALMVTASALLLAQSPLLSLFPLAVAVLIGAVIIDAHILGR